MSDEIHDVTTITFSGPRFEDAGLELEVLSELLTYRRLLIETAKELWRQGNLGLRLPRGFEKSVRLKVYSIEPGSVVVPVKRVVRHDDSSVTPGSNASDEIEDAAMLIDATITAVSEERSIPDGIPKGALRLLAGFGNKLREGEAIRTQSPRSALAAEITFETRQRFKRLLIGGRLEKRAFEMPWVANDRQYSEIRDARLLPAPNQSIADDYDDSVPPLWQSLVDLGASLPAEEWDRVPTDLAENLDHYLHGGSSEDE